MNWSEIKEPNKEVSYNHVILESPLGKFVIDWKGWKENPSYDIQLNDEWIGSEYDLETAKGFVNQYLVDKTNKLNEFIKPIVKNICL